MPQKPIGSGDHQIEKFEEGETRLRSKDLFLIGKLWLTASKTGLLGPNWSILPTVQAAPPKDDTPQKPPRMKYKDLPLYSSPHYDYKNYLEDKAKCPGYKRRLLHECILPCVRDTRKSWCQSYCELSKDLKEIKGELCCAVRSRKNEFISYMRSPDNLTLRQVVLAVGGLTGFYLGSGRFLLARRVVCTGLGLLTAGALCFPKETDETFRNFTYHTAKLIIKLYNIYCNKNGGLRDGLPCATDMPDPLATTKRKPPDCPPKK